MTNCLEKRLEADECVADDLQLIVERSLPGSWNIRVRAISEHAEILQPYYLGVYLEPAVRAYNNIIIETTIIVKYVVLCAQTSFA